MRSKRTQLRRIGGGQIALGGMAIIILLVGTAFFVESGSAQNSVVAGPTSFRVGERLAYTISFGKFQDAGYAETHVVSRGKISGKDAVEVRGKIKTIDLVSAAFFLFDESRSVFAVPDTGLPQYIVSTSLGSVIPKESIRNYLTQPTSNFDLLTLLYKVRESGGVGSFTVSEDDQVYTLTFQAAGVEKVRTAAGDFDTTISIVQGEYLTAHGIKDLKINFSNDEFHVPVAIRLKTAKGDFRVLLSSISLPEPEAATASPTPTPAPTPKSAVGVKPTPPPALYTDDLPLMPELGFQIGETLNYRVALAGKSVGILTLSVKERRMFNKADSLLLTAAITEVEPGADILRVGDFAKVQVDPETLTPTLLESMVNSRLPGFNQSVEFDKKTGVIRFGGKGQVDAPVGTQSFLSLLYAMRSFNLRPSSNLQNPVNDTRVAVFWDTTSYVFTLRPSKPEDITLDGQVISAQQIAITTNNKELDALNLKVWLRTEDRLPLRFSAGRYQADLINSTANLR